ncbi:hypothetical protein HCN51_57340 [Nonomuraea sp. FMUSA5-5]|uniref:Uncharacterized protein n=1 Tax=Nonomuraea composti TaxID=2720023 RepID=A0ABX1BMC4_9ACTN|nr:hypothetical protein [Nonomuraea sp. FMUSA5-5]NJP98888.1 hypothetical protein [Nonomuraea sp. FMUSA5-5]
MEGAGLERAQAQGGGGQGEGLAEVTGAQQADPVAAGGAVLDAHAFDDGGQDDQERRAAEVFLPGAQVGGVIVGEALLSSSRLCWRLL